MSTLVAQSRAAGLQHTFACFEEPEKSQFVIPIRTEGGQVVSCPNPAELFHLASQADVVQLERWNHPATIGQLCDVEWPAMRLCTWSHVSGLFTPTIPPGLIRSSLRFLLTSPCTYADAVVKRAASTRGEHVSVVPSTGGLWDLPVASPSADDTLRAGYFGSLNLAKIHPDYVAFVAAVDIPGFQVRMVGDPLNQAYFERQCEALGRQLIRGQMLPLEDPPSLACVVRPNLIFDLGFHNGDDSGYYLAKNLRCKSKPA